MEQELTYHQITIDEWLEMVKKGDTYDRQIKEGFIGMGYVLKQLKAAGRFDGFSDIYEYAENRWGYKRTTVKNLIAVNDAYSVGGNSEYLDDRYKGYGYTQLIEMKQLDEEDRTLIPTDATRNEIKDFKEFMNEPVEEAENTLGQPVDQNPEKAQKDLNGVAFSEGESESEKADKIGVSENANLAAAENEPETEGKSEDENPEKCDKDLSGVAFDESTLSPFKRCIYDYFKDKKNALISILSAIQDETDQNVIAKKTFEALTPAGSVTHRKGLVYLFMYDSFDKGCAYKNRAKGDETVEMSYSRMADEIDEIYHINGWEDPETIWEKYYGGQPVDQNPEKAQKDLSGTAFSKEESKIENADKMGISENKDLETAGNASETGGKSENENPDKCDKDLNGVAFEKRQGAADDEGEENNIDGDENNIEKDKSTAKDPLEADRAKERLDSDIAQMKIAIEGYELSSNELSAKVVLNIAERITTSASLFIKRALQD